MKTLNDYTFILCPDNNGTFKEVMAVGSILMDDQPLFLFMEMLKLEGDYLEQLGITEQDFNQLK